ncbi:MAG TPA: metal-dependent hydrolase [Bryobacteraceae bacterium]|nr:metal-dependent hydrolase [Bryobacteraceae bacterium]
MIEITWLGHGTFQLALETGERILIDPWINGNPKSPAGFEVTRIDTMLITHGHFDHVGDAVALARKFKPQVIANFEICAWLETKGIENACGMNKGGSQQAGPVRVTMTHALHSSGISDEGKILYGGEAGGYMIHLPDGRTIYFAGDTAIHAEMGLYAELYRPVIAFLPIGDHFTMSPTEAALACRMLEVHTVIPMHFATFPLLSGTPEALAERLKGSDCRVWPLEPGIPVHW